MTQYKTSVNYQAPSPSGLTDAAVNNAIASAQASADPRFNLKEYDRPGVSRGAGSRAQAGIKAAQSLADGIAAAYQIPMQSAAASAADDLAFQQGREQLGLGASGLGMQSDYANALAALERQRQAMQFQGNALGGLLGGFNLDNFLGY
jgi:hypothetical protein